MPRAAGNGAAGTTTTDSGATGIVRDGRHRDGRHRIGEQVVARHEPWRGVERVTPALLERQRLGRGEQLFLHARRQPSGGRAP